MNRLREGNADANRVVNLPTLPCLPFSNSWKVGTDQKTRDFYMCRLLNIR